MCVHFLQCNNPLLQPAFCVDLVLVCAGPRVHLLQAYVEQNDNFYSMLTVAETLTMSSQLQLSPSTSAEDKQAYVDNLISVLGLAKVSVARGTAVAVAGCVPCRVAMCTC